jgi:hypothetical protein
MLKKCLSVLLAVLFTVGCMAVCASAADGDVDEPVKTDSGYYVGQILKPGDTITSVYDTCEMLTVSYSVSSEDAENVTSALQKAYASEDFVGVSSFRDNIASFSSGDVYKGVYTVKGVGEEVNEMETESGKYQTALDIYNALDSDAQKALDKQLKKKKQEFVLTIDYDYAKTTYYQYTSITAWEVVYVNETENAITIRLQAVYETREPTGWESFVEQLYSKWRAFLDVLGDILIKLVPQLVSFWAKLLGNVEPV